MVTVGPSGRITFGPPSRSQYVALITCFVIFGIGAGYVAGLQPLGAGWRAFSWHPLLMTSGFVGMFGSAAVTKKLGGYTNTKLHGMMAWAGNFLALGGLYAIYKHKNTMGYAHLTTPHALAGISVVSCCILSGIAGGFFLHPDFGTDKTNKTIRTGHKWFSRLTLMLAWFTAFMGLMQLTSNLTVLAMYGLPLLILAPFTLM